MIGRNLHRGDFVLAAAHDKDNPGYTIQRMDYSLVPDHSSALAIFNLWLFRVETSTEFDVFRDTARERMFDAFQREILILRPQGASRRTVLTEESG